MHVALSLTPQEVPASPTRRIWIRDADAEGNPVDPAFRDANGVREADLLVNGIGIEVKTWRPETWEAWGRCVTPAQAPSMVRKSGAVIWTIVDDEAEPVKVEVVGWNTPEEIAATEVRATGPEYRPVMNHQVSIAAIRDPDEPLRLLRTGSATF